MNILLVDDDSVDRETVRRALRKEVSKFSLTEVETAQDGLEALDAQQYDVVLLDYMMPKLNGIDMMVKLRAKPRLGDTAIVMMSGSNDNKLALSCLQAGAQDFIPKEEISASKLSRAIFQAQKRFELESKLHDSYCRVREMAETDSLTGLANRYYFERALNSATRENARGKKILALLLLDLDHFKNVNDSYGHETGDMLLKKVVEKISASLRGEELFARLGGDEFAIILTNLELGREADLVARRIVKALEQPIEVKGHIIQTGVSIGLAVHPGNAESSEELVRFADIAMYQAKKLGRNQFCFFQDIMQQQFSRTFQIELELKEAAKNNDFELHYQPVIQGKEQHLVGFEALIRWPGCSHACYPDEFIPIAEQSDTINTIGKWVLTEAINQLSQWLTTFPLSLTMAVNLSPIQLADPKSVGFIRKALEKSAVKPTQLVLEITETALFDCCEQTIKTIERLNGMGCQIALDDFGTGYSSLSHLLTFPIDIVKLDKSMLPATAENARHMSILRGMAAMAKIVDLKVIAEGVENSFHFLLCKDLEISEYQGYFFGRPENSRDIEERWLNNSSPELVQ